jgi:Uma2 family endonuclease
VKSKSGEIMVITSVKPTSLEAFLNLPESKPASEFLNGKITQKHMPQGEHSLLQGTLCETINQSTRQSKIAIAFPELRCTFGGASIVPDLSVFRWDRIPRHDSGKIANRFETHPDWAIEILSPEQRQKKVLVNLLHCVKYETELGWLLDPEEENILVVFPGSRIQIFEKAERLPVINGIDLELTPEQIFSWLSF